MSTTAMEFWGVEVKSGQSLKIHPGDSRVVHLSQASLGEVKKDRGSEPVYLYLKAGDTKVVLGTLSAEKLPQLSFDLVVEKDFELSHNWKNGSVYFTGYKVRMEGGTDDEDDNSDSDEDVKISRVNNGKPELQAKSVSGKSNVTKPDASAAKQNVKDVKLHQNNGDSDSEDSDMNDSSSDDDETSDDVDPNLVPRETGSDESDGDLEESDEDDDDEGTEESESDDEDMETPEKAVPSKKRPAESAVKTPVPDKKTKFITPQKTEGKKGVPHTATPHPSKHAGKAPASNSDPMKPQAKKSTGSYACKSCNRLFTTEGGLQAHTKAKHSTAA